MAEFTGNVTLNENDELRIGVPFEFVKEDADGNLLVEGVATQELPDKQGDIVDFVGAKAAFQAWPGNIREQHDPNKAVGVRVTQTFDEPNKAVRLKAMISKDGAPQTWAKVKQGILRGFSISGPCYEKAVEAIPGGKSLRRILRFGLNEVSVVDNPALPQATFAICKSEGGSVVAGEGVVFGDFDFIVKTPGVSLDPEVASKCYGERLAELEFEKATDKPFVMPDKDDDDDDEDEKPKRKKPKPKVEDEEDEDEGDEDDEKIAKGSEQSIGGNITILGREVAQREETGMMTDARQCWIVKGDAEVADEDSFTKSVGEYEKPEEVLAKAVAGAKVEALPLAVHKDVTPEDLADLIELGAQVSGMGLSGAEAVGILKRATGEDEDAIADTEDEEHTPMDETTLKRLVNAAVDAATEPLKKQIDALGARPEPRPEELVAIARIAGDDEAPDAGDTRLYKVIAGENGAGYEDAKVAFLAKRAKDPPDYTMTPDEQTMQAEILRRGGERTLLKFMDT